MNFTSRIQGILLRPRAEWPVIDAEPSSVGALYTGYLVPLALIGAVARFIGMSIVGLDIPFVGRIRVPILSGLTSAVLALVAMLVGLYVWALIINALAPTFGGRKDMRSALKLAVYSATPALVAGVLSILPSLMFVQLLAAIYALYVLYLGFPVLMQSPRERAGAYTAATVVSGMVVGIVLGAVTAALGGGAYGLGASSRVARDAAAAQAGQNMVAGMLGAAGGGSAETRNAAATLVAGAVAAGQQAEAAERAGTTVIPAVATDAQTSAASAGAAVAALGAMVNGGKAAIALVPFQTLKAMLPASAGALPRTDATGETTNVAGVSGSSAEGTYGGTGAGRVSVKITDMGNARGVLALGQMAFAVESESDHGFEKNVVLGGQKVHEKWTASGSDSELDAFVGDRFMIEVHGTGVDMATAERAFSAIDFGKLAGAR